MLCRGRRGFHTHLAGQPGQGRQSKNATHQQLAAVALPPMFDGGNHWGNGDTEQQYREWNAPHNPCGARRDKRVQIIGVRRQSAQGDQRRKRGRDNGCNNCEFARAGRMSRIMVVRCVGLLGVHENEFLQGVLAAYVYQQVLPIIICLRYLRRRKFFRARVVNDVRG